MGGNAKVEEDDPSQVQTHGPSNETLDVPEVNGLGDMVEKLHSQLILEAVQLRQEVAVLKRKKWVLRSVLVNGGETERKAIDLEIAELRKGKHCEPLTEPAMRE